MRSNVVRVLARLGAALCVVVVLIAGVATGTASAGGAGQQVQVCAGFSAQRYIKIEGTNQNNQWTSMTMPVSGWCATSWGWWWVGSVRTTSYDGNWNQLGFNWCGPVPAWQSTDVYNCIWHG